MSVSSLARGAKGPEVKRLQELLTTHGYACSADGFFGSQTEALVLAFQRAKKLPADGVVGPNTWKALEGPVGAFLSPPEPLPDILERIKAAGYRIMWSGDYHLNLFGIRATNMQSNSFDDVLGCAYTVNGMWRVHYWPGTTDPGRYWLANPSRVEGTAILVPGQYVDTWQIGLHRNSYEALCQRKPVKVYRDADKNSILDLDPKTMREGVYGINIHRATSNGVSSQVDRWSAGCQVHARSDGFNEMMDLARKQVEHLGLTTFTYTLL